MTGHGAREKMRAVLDSHIFREYDIRGIAERELRDDVVELIGKACGTIFSRKGVEEVAVGRDVRTSSPRIKRALAKGLTGSGVNVVDVGTVPTPLLYFSVVKLGLGGGIMVTGSHNPIQFNGLKIMMGTTTIYGEDIQEIFRQAVSGDLMTGRGSERSVDIVPRYLEDLKQRIKLARPLSLVIDAGNGTAGEIALGLFRDLGCRVVGLYCEPDGTFPHHLPDPTVQDYMRDLSEKVRETGAEVGIGYDGDADRIGAVDEKGIMIYGDKLLAVFAGDLLERLPGATVVFDVKCSQGLIEFIEKRSGKPFMWKTGHSLLKAKIKELGAPLGGEMSGHMFFSHDYYGFDDAIFASLKLAEIISRHSGSVSSLLRDFPPFISTPEIRIDCPDTEKFRVVEEITARFKEKFEVIDIDGVRVVTGEGWGLLRASNTQPVLVLRFEARDPQGFERVKQLFKTELMKYTFVDWKAL
jgi:phosphomannomutase/phosphoglucomutase